MMVSWAGIKIACLVSWSTMTKIVSNPEDDRSFSMKSIEMEFYGCSGIGELFEGSIGLVTLWLQSHTSDTGLAELLYISTEAGLGVLVWQPLITKTNDHTSGKSLSGISSGKFTRELDKESLLN